MSLFDTNDFYTVFNEKDPDGPLFRTYDLIDAHRYKEAKSMLMDFIVTASGKMPEDECALYCTPHEPMEYLLCRMHLSWQKPLEKLTVPIDMYYLLLGVVYSNTDDPPQACKMYDKARAWNPARFEAYTYYAAECRGVGDTEGYIQETKKVYHFAWTSRQFATILRMYGTYYWETGQTEPSIACFALSRRWDPFSPRAAKSLEAIRHMTGKSPDGWVWEKIVALSYEYDFPIAPDNKIIAMARCCAEDYRNDGDEEMALYFERIVDDLDGSRLL